MTETLWGLRIPCGGGVQPGRSRQAGTAATQRDFLSQNRGGVLAPSPPPPRPAGASRARPQRSRPEHPWLLSSPSQRHVDLEVAFAYPPPLARPTPSGGSWVSLKPAQLRFIILRPRRVCERRIYLVAESFKPIKVKSSLSASFSHQYFLTLLARSHKAHCREMLWVHVCVGDWRA